MEQSKYSYEQSRRSIIKIVQCDDNQRLNYIIQIFDKYQMKEKRYETKAWHNYFRQIALNPVVFYQNNNILFDQDNQYDNEQSEIIDSILIHGNLHVNQFEYSIDDLTDKYVFKMKQHKTKIGSFIRDLKRLAINLSLIGYYQGCNDIEMIEIVNYFIREYIKSVLSIKNHFKRQKSNENDQNKSFQLKKQYSVNESMEVEHEMHEINWQSMDSVNKLMIFAKELAICTGDLHSQSNINIKLCSIDQQKELMNEICFFTMIYVQIAERDHRLFFKHFRNETTFRSVKNNQIQYPFVHTYSVPILIIGGGIGGMATALSFAQAGIRVRLIEKNREFIEVGAGMQLAPNCSRLLDRLGILEKVQMNAVYPKEIVWMDALSGQRLTSINLGKEFIQRFGYPYIVVHRADLLNVLHQACLQTSLVTMETNRSVITIDERPKSIMIQCQDGTRYHSKMVIAADGLWSTCRKFVCDDGLPISVGYVTYRGTINIEQVSKEAGLENVQFWIGPNMHLVQYPIRRGELFNQAAVFKSKQLPNQTDQWGTKEELNQIFTRGCSQVQNALKLIQTNFRWPVYDRNPLLKWSRGRLVLLGDAAHPMLQYAAQGAAQALEDAHTLTNIYKKYGPSKIETIFQEYEQQRIPRSSKVVQFARQIGTFAHHDGISKIIRDALLHSHHTNNFDFLNWLYAQN